MTSAPFASAKLEIYHDKSILPHLVTLMGNPMTPVEIFFVLCHCILLLATGVSPYHEYICTLMAYRNNFCHENCNFDRLDPFGSHHA